MKPNTPAISKSKSSQMERIIAAFNPFDKQTTGIISKPIDNFLPRKNQVFLKGKGLWKESYEELISYQQELSF